MARGTKTLSHKKGTDATTLIGSNARAARQANQLGFAAGWVAGVAARASVAASCAWRE
jgi:hypothetical protein